MSADLYLGLSLFFGAFLIWLAGRGGKGPPTALFLVLFASSYFSAPPAFDAPDTGPAPDLDPFECYRTTMSFDDYIIALPRAVRIVYRWPFTWCVESNIDFRGFEGEWYFSAWDTTFSDWSRINQVILYVDDRPIAWVTNDGSQGFDPTFDVGPYLIFKERRDNGSGSSLCLPVEVDLDAWTSTERLEFEYTVESWYCPSDPDWQPITYYPVSDD